MESFWIGKKKKKRDKPLSPFPKCTSCKMHPDPILFAVNSSKDAFDTCRLCLFSGLKVTDFLQRIQEGCVRKGGQRGGQGGCGVGGGMCACWGAEISSEKENWGVFRRFRRTADGGRGVKKIQSGHNVK